jgi:hypothetical protein
MNQPLNTKNSTPVLTEQKHMLIKSGKIKLTPVSKSVQHGVVPSDGGGGDGG